MRQITIKENTRELPGFPAQPVSRVLNNNGRFSEETRKKVLKAIEEYGYRPNVVAKSLRTNRSKTIGVIVPDITNEFFASIVLAIENYCVPNGYSVFVCNTSEDLEQEKKYVKDLEAKGVDGLIYLSGNSGLPDAVINRKLPIVCIDRKPDDPEAVIVESDNYKGGYLAAEELLNAGCRKIVLIRDYRDVSTMHQRHLGYRQALKDWGVELDESYVVRIPIDVEASRNAVSALVRQGFPFDGIFAATDWLAVGALMALREHGIRVPEEVKLVGYDNISLTLFTSPPITTIHQNKWELGRAAAEVLLDMIHGAQFGRTSPITMDVQLIRRESTRR